MIKKSSSLSIVDLDYKSFNLNFYTYLLSALLVKKHGYRIEMYCDEYSKTLYSMIPYDKINIVDFSEDGIDTKFWIYGKIKTHTLMNEPYVHIDGDVLLFRDVIGDNLKKYGSVVQMVENEKTMDTFNMNYGNSLDPFIRLNDGIAWNKYNLHSYNCGVVGFHDIKLKNKYADTVKKTLYSLSKSENFDNVKHKYAGMFLIVEQSLLYYVLNEEKKKPYEIIDYNEIVKRNYDWNSIAKEVGYVHLWGYTKYSPKTIEAIKSKIKKYFNEYYWIIEEYESKYQIK
jgi:hypothetical protein